MWDEEPKLVNNFFIRVGVILIGHILHPIASIKSSIHAAKSQTSWWKIDSGHKIAWVCINFRYGIKCHECDKIFLDEDC